MGFGSTLGGQEDVVSVGIIGRLSFLCASNTQLACAGNFFTFSRFLHETGEGETKQWTMD
jgi:hypothetical protein